MTTLAEASYNERLFGSGWRARLHLARFVALRGMVERYGVRTARVIELGCYDGKTLRYLPELPSRYLGLDADWEGGLDLGRAAWKDHPEFEFRYCVKPEDVPLGERFDLAVCMETLEHVPPDSVDGYLRQLARVTDGHLFVSVPNEKGLTFFFKYLAKRFVVGDAPSYTFGEFVNASLGRMHRIRRDEHKGFDYDTMIAAVARHFDIVTVTALPFPWLPRSLGFGIAILARTRRGAPAA